MRKHRYALIASSLVAALAVVVPLTLAGTAAPVQPEALSSNSTSIQATPSPTTPAQFGMLRQAIAAQDLAAVVQAQEANFLTALSLSNARARSASSVRTSSTSPVATSQAPAASTGCSAPTDANYALDAQTTDTPDWCCIRSHESDANRYRDYSGAYGFQPGYYASMAPADQDALALSIFHHNGDKFGPSAWSTHTVCHLE